MILKKSSNFGMELCKEYCVFLSLLLLTGVCISLAVYWLIPNGPGVSVDAVKYFKIALNIFEGKGIYADGAPVTHFPPVYPLLLAAFNHLQHDSDILQAARLLTAILFGLNVVLFSIAAYISTSGSRIAALIAFCIYFVYAPVDILVQLDAMSEPLFVSYTLFTFIMIYVYIRNNKFTLLLFFSMMAGSAILTRYIGITILPAVVVSLVLLTNNSFYMKVKHAIISTSIVLTPLILWMIRNIIVAQNATNRKIKYHPINKEQAELLFVFAILAAFIFIVLIILRKKDKLRTEKKYNTELPIILAVFMLSYVLFLGISISFFDAHTPIDARIMYPYKLSFVLVMIAVCWWLLREIGNVYMWSLLTIVILLIISVNGNKTLLIANNIYNNGLGYNSFSWKKSKVVSYLSDIPEYMKIYSNGPDAIYFLSEKETANIPLKINPNTNIKNKRYNKKMKFILSEIKEGKALIAYLDRITWRWYLPSNEELEEEFGFPVLRRFEDGVIYGKPNLNSNY